MKISEDASCKTVVPVGDGGHSCERETDGRAQRTRLQPAQRPRLPPWLKVKLPSDPRFVRTMWLLDELELETVCESAKCPNRWECWSRGTATIMIAGNRCTRACRFCAVETAKPFPLSPDEPQRVAEAVGRLGLRHVVITAVARDDLPDGGAVHFARTIRAVRERCAGIVIEVLVPDFNGSRASIEAVLAERPDVFNHNLETVRRLTSSVRWRATYEQSLSLLAHAKSHAADVRTKSGIMLGLGEGEEEVRQALRDLRGVGCDIVTMGQYLQPTLRHLPVVEFVSPERFAAWAKEAREMGFLHVACGPRVRSSYHADDFAPRAITP